MEVTLKPQFGMRLTTLLMIFVPARPLQFRAPLATLPTSIVCFALRFYEITIVVVTRFFNSERKLFIQDNIVFCCVNNFVILFTFNAINTNYLFCCDTMWKGF